MFGLDISPSDSLYIILFLVALGAGIVDAIAGGGGLVTIPALMLAGVPPMLALGTNRFQAVIGELTTSLVYLRSRQLPLDGIALGIVATAVGAILGACAVSVLDKTVLEYLLPILMVLVTMYSIFSKRLRSVTVSDAKLSTKQFMLLCGIGIGFYNGFFGPGTGSFWMLAFAVLLGYTIKQATMATKPLNLVGNFVSLLIFVYLGHVDYALGVIMGAGQIVGSIVGGRWVILFGTKLVRPVFITVTVVMTAKLLVERGLLSYIV